MRTSTSRDASPISEHPRVVPKRRPYLSATYAFYRQLQPSAATVLASAPHPASECEFPSWLAGLSTEAKILAAVVSDQQSARAGVALEQLAEGSFLVRPGIAEDVTECCYSLLWRVPSSTSGARRLLSP